MEYCNEKKEAFDLFIYFAEQYSHSGLGGRVHCHDVCIVSPMLHISSVRAPHRNLDRKEDFLQLAAWWDVSHIGDKKHNFG